MTFGLIRCQLQDTATVISAGNNRALVAKNPLAGGPKLLHFFSNTQVF